VLQRPELIQPALRVGSSRVPVCDSWLRSRQADLQVFAPDDHRRVLAVIRCLGLR
jgi:hypothetical protein